MRKTYLVLFLFALALRLGVLYELRGLDPMPAGTDMRIYYAQALDPAWPSPAPLPAFQLDIAED